LPLCSPRPRPPLCSEQKLVFFGAGSAGIGVADMIVAMMVEGMPYTHEQLVPTMVFVA
jgi:malic enzyme